MGLQVVLKKATSNKISGLFTASSGQSVMYPDLFHFEMKQTNKLGNLNHLQLVLSNPDLTLHQIQTSAFIPSV